MFKSSFNEIYKFLLLYPEMPDLIDTFSELKYNHVLLNKEAMFPEMHH